jgi:hypothetical protein
MGEFIEIISAPQNAGLSVAMGFIALYWISVIILGIGIDLLDGLMGLADHALDGGTDPTTGLDTHIDGSSHVEAPFMASAFRFFNFGHVPATIIFTAIITVAWLGSMLLHGWYKDFGGGLQTLIFIATLIGALLLSKPLTAPLKDVFHNDDSKGPERTNLIGCDCILTMPVTQEQSGQAEAKTAGNRFLVVSVRCAPGQGPIPKGGRATITSVDPNAGGYLVRLPGSNNPSSEGGNTK